MKTNEQKAFDFAADTIKQLITLSTAIIALTITFSNDIVGANISNSSSIYWAWGLFLASVIFGIWTLMALTGTLQPMKKKKKANQENEEQKEQNGEPENEEESININGFNVKLPAGLQILTFIVALIFTVIFGVSSIVSQKDKLDPKDCIEIIKRSEYELVKPVSIDTLKVK
ncbi:hypothetical protein [Abyssalbus ytuae]|uniref:Uncharacterized protein n=1 Tax=Abyssalbus ytuae TaxID=2926907 RepID=A0A9E7CTQ6_9FLAO|nr:hypothetical protein [Abyssalbus ytuae]UOB18476.1 hypothetical protein MQE35_04090 [Abyssalbus ytuae]